MYSYKPNFIYQRNFYKLALIRFLNIIGLFNVSVLLLRFVFKLYSANPSDLLTQIVYALSYPLVIPYSFFTSEIRLSGASVFDTAGLVGLFVSLFGALILNVVFYIWFTRAGKYRYAPHMRTFNYFFNKEKNPTKQNIRVI